MFLLAAALAVATSRGSTSGAAPQAGNWEGTGLHGLPLSFSLRRRHGRLVATSIAVGAPLACPANERDAEAVPLSLVTYSGPAGDSPAPDGSAVLSGEVPGRGQVARLTGEFSSPSSGTLSLQVQSAVGCGWPTRTLSWRVRRAARDRISDGLWTASVSGPGITSGAVELRVAAFGRVIRSIRTSYRCRSATVSGKGGFAAAPAYEFIRPSGRFYSPLRGDPLKGHRTLWSGRFARDRGLRGTLVIFDTCARRVVRLTFQR